ncbi:MAG: tRNA 2-thiouridine(34) synthase MnmA [Patescibacteria group bacterium]|nr:tRNA 2-thiouridine(34) synthase MnmA [Patescibacteria group bacterium]
MKQGTAVKKKSVFVAMSRRRQPALRVPPGYPLATHGWRFRQGEGYGGQAGGAKDSKSKRVFVAMSGGVDSSVAALLLKRQGYDVTGVFMRCYNLDGCAVRDAEDARRVAGRLHIPFYVWDFEKEYKKHVMHYMIDGYRRGITPNPDVMCNKEIKFGLFFERAMALGADYVATGHYVKIRKSKIKDKNVYKLYRAKDNRKDQSYFLWTLTQRQLAHCLFPIGEYLKSEVRTVARRAGLATATKKDSQGICFLGKFSLKDFLKKHIRARRGKIVNISGVEMGIHDGAVFYTIGQRHGFNLNNVNRELGIANQGETKPYYVAGKDIKNNLIILAEGGNNQSLYKKEVSLAEVNYIHPISDSRFPISVRARVRYRQPLAEARIIRGKTKNKQKGEKIPLPPHFSLRFTQPQKCIAEGQSAVWYSPRGEMLGGGIIVSAGK